MSEHVHVVCPHCNTTNRVLRERLDAGARSRGNRAHWICPGCSGG